MRNRYIFSYWFRLKKMWHVRRHTIEVVETLPPLNWQETYDLQMDIGKAFMKAFKVEEIYFDQVMIEKVQP
jgi:hypothetical protein